MVRSAQELVDKYTGVELENKICEAVDEIQSSKEPFHPLNKEAQAFLDQEVTATVWHGTRRKESIEELKKNGFCTYTDEQAVQWLAEALTKLDERTKVGPRVTKQLEKRKASILYEIRQPYRCRFSVTGIEEAACGEDAPERLMSGWADRNPEFMWDFLWSPWRVKPKVVDAILTEQFGEPLKVKVKIKTTVRSLLSPQDIHLEQKCFLPEDIVSIEKCPPKAKGAK